MGCLQLTYEPNLKIVHRTGELMRSHEAKVVQLWLRLDVKTEKFYPLTGYNYVANSPILLIDPNGEDWTIIKHTDKKGSVLYELTYTGAVLNSSSKKFDMVKFAEAIEKQVESLLKNFTLREDGTFEFGVTTKVNLRIITDKKDVADDESLIEIKDGNHADFDVYGKDSKAVAVGRAMNGKEVSLNASYVADMINGKNKKTIPHELGHTLGLKHPLMDTSFWGLKKGPTYNSPKDNFMTQGTITNPTGPTKEQMSRVYRLYTTGQLNSKDIEPLESE